MQAPCPITCPHCQGPLARKVPGGHWCARCQLAVAVYPDGTATVIPLFGPIERGLVLGCPACTGNDLPQGTLYLDCRSERRPGA